MSGGPVRQLSLHQASTVVDSGGRLRKQRSVDASSDCSLRVTASSIRTGGHFPQEPVATRASSGSVSAPVEGGLPPPQAKNCTGAKFLSWRQREAK
jgi:hypothetical protein